MNPCPSILQSFLNFNVLGGSPWLGPVPTMEQLSAMASAMPRLAIANGFVPFVLDRTIALLRSLEAALAARLQDRWCKSQQEVVGGAQAVSAAEIADDTHTANGVSNPLLRLPTGEHVCPHCSVQFVFSAGGNGNGAEKREQRQANPLPSEREVVAMVEKALRRLFDFACLGESPLAAWEIVRRLAAERQSDETGAGMPKPGTVTHVERGKALYALLVQAVKTLRPDGKPPDRHAVPPREWFHYLILHESYVEGELNRNIMSRLYIGEGTFNRARRMALLSVARTVLEMERQARREQSRIE